MATDIFVTNNSVWWVGGTGTQAGGSTNGGATAQWFRENYTDDSDIMGADGSPINAITNGIDFADDILEGATASTFNNVQKGMVAFLSGGNVIADGRYDVLESPLDGTLRFSPGTFVGTQANDTVCRVGGAFENLQQALDEVDPSTKSTRIYINKLTTLTAPLDVPSGSVVENSWLRVRGYNTVAGDQDFGGSFYGGALDALKEAKGWPMDNSAATWTEIDGNDNAGDTAISLDNDDNIEFSNLFIHNITAVATNNLVDFANSPVNTRFVNCRFVDSFQGMQAVGFNLVIDDCFFADSITGRAIHCNSSNGAVIINSVFDDNDGIFGRFANIQNCLFHNSAFQGVSIGQQNVTVNNCTFYNMRRYGIVQGGAGNRGIVEWNNIFVVADGSTDNAAVSEAGGGSVIYSDYSCAWSIASQPPTKPWLLLKNSQEFQGPNSIIADPLFFDASVGNFKLKPTSPCINTGRPSLDGGFTSMGFWPRKSFLGVR